MKIRPRNIPKFAGGGTPQWYLDLYNQHALGGWNDQLRYNYANQNLNTNDHYNAANLDMVYRKQNAYTNTPAAVGQDIQSFYDSDGGNMSSQEFVDFYNKNAQKIRDHWTTNQTYNASSAGDHNRLYRRMFQNRSNTSLSPGSEYNIGYQEGTTPGGYDIQDIEGSSTWLRRMDRYENEFDPNNPDENRIHTIRLKDGTTAQVYKKANGDIGLLSTQGQTGSSVVAGQGNDSITGDHKDKYGFDWKKLGEELQKQAPNLLSAGRLAYSLDTNKRMYEEQLKGIKPQLQGSYHTHRQVVGDEATKQAYYRRAAQGQTRASRPFTSDADRQMAYQMEAKRVGDELRARGDLADNQEIRRTSDESNQHQWQNQARDNQVANSNYLALLQANKQKHDLKSNYLAANHSSWNNYLLEKETRMRQRQAENQALEDQIYALDAQHRLTNDSNYQGLYDGMTDAYNKALEKTKKADGTYDYMAARNDPDFRKAQQAFQNRQYELQRQQYTDMLNRRSGKFFAKDGMKIQFKKKDDLLYKTAKDAVDHYRKMVKLTDDSTLKSFKKPLNVIKPPKSTRKYQTGGVAPFTVYTPAPLGGETTTSTQASATAGATAKGSSKKDGDSPLDIIKDLFKNLEGLPSDVNGVYQAMSGFLARAKAFGNEISSDDLASMYLAQMQQINNIKFSKAAYDKAKEQATNNDALNEFAVNTNGQVAVQKKDGSLAFMSWKEVKESGEVNPLTNNDLLNLRAYTKDLQFQDQLFNVVNNGIGVNKIAEFIKAQLPKLGSNEQTIEGYTKKQSNQIRQGFEQLLQDAPDGDYHYSRKTEEQEQQIQMALGYIKTILPRNMQTILGIHADLQGISSNDMLKALIGAQASETNDLKLTAVTGKAAKSKTGEGTGDGIKSNPIMQMLQEQGGVPRTYELITRDSNVKMSINGTYYSQIPKVTEDMSVDKMLTTSGMQGILDSKQGITFGDQNIDPSQLKDIMYSNSGGMIVTLPCKIVNGHKEVNLGVRETYEKAVQEVESKGISRGTQEYYKALGEALQQHGLSNLVDSNGYPDKSKFGQFLVVEAYATSKIKGLDKSSQYIEKVSNPDDSLEQRLVKALSTNNKKDDYSLDINYWLWGDDVYRGSMFIPLTNNLNASINAWGSQIDIDEARDIENKYQNFNKASTMKSSNSNVLNETE